MVSYLKTSIMFQHFFAITTYPYLQYNICDAKRCLGLGLMQNFDVDGFYSKHTTCRI